MALIDNYAKLKDAVSEWLGRVGDLALAGRADEFISLFESEFVSDPENRSLDMQRIQTFDITDTAPVQLPPDYLEMIRLRVLDASGNPTRRLDYVTPDEASNYDLTAWSGGKRGFYTVLAGAVHFAPQSQAPVGNKLELAFYGFTPLSDAAPTNWLLQKWANVYLYGALMQAAAYIDDKETVQFWNGAFTAATDKLARTERKRKLGAGPLVIRPATRNIV